MVSHNEEGPNQDTDEELESYELEVGETTEEPGPTHIGDLDAVDFARPPPRRTLATLLPWGLLLMLAGLGAWFYMSTFSPMQIQLNDARVLLRETRTANADLDDQVEKLGTVKDELEAAREKLTAELEEKQRALEELHTAQDELAARLRKEIDKGTVAIKQAEGDLVVDLIDRVLFDSGEATLNEQGRAVLREVGATFLKLPDNIIEVGGHTDAVPISDKLLEQFPSNWELSSARAINVVRFFQDEMKIPGARLAAVAYSQYRPIAKNSSRSGRRRNRRIEVKLKPRAKK